MVSRGQYSRIASCYRQTHRAEPSAENLKPCLAKRTVLHSRLLEISVIVFVLSGLFHDQIHQFPGT